nr:neurogenic locus notch homolog protein 3-like [Lytechinus pictus]
MDYQANECPSGYYCELNTPDPYAYPCPPGTFNNLTIQHSQAACVDCLPGWYCAGYGDSHPTDECDEGWYCSGGANESQPSTNGGECQPGYFCPRGSGAPEPCTAGQYCDLAGLALPTNSCDPGYYCPSGSSDPRQEDCTVGHFCPEGSSLPTPCSNGTYNPSLNQDEFADCLPCQGGFYCNETGASTTSGECAAQYYCPPGQVTPTPGDYLCPTGHYCVANLATPTRCQDGTYQDDMGKDSCLTCEEGYFCDNTLYAVSDLSNASCPAGYYCPAGTKRANQFPCPSGTYNNLTNAVNDSWCTECIAGFFCQTPGLSAPEDECYPGYYCLAGEDNPTPNPCPEGNYCPSGSYKPTPCPAGTISSGTTNVNVTDCAPCDPGRYCTANSSSNGLTLPCDAGYICTGGSNTPTPGDIAIGYTCPQGHYCEAGATKERRCDQGTYAPSVNHGECLVCPEGTSCPETGMNFTLPCPEGYYCLPETRDNGMPCPLGTFSNITGLSNESQCQACFAGMHCNETGLAWPSGFCEAGFLCISGAMESAPDDGINGPCPTGAYCEEGVTSEALCPPGTFNPTRGGQNISDCLPCTSGKFCGTSGLSSPTGWCREGYYCPSDAEVYDNRPSEFECPAGHFCLNDTATPYPCEPGTYQPNTRSIDCRVCPERYYCLQNTSHPEPCSPYTYCPEGSPAPINCPNGTYTMDNVTHLAAADECQYCPTGSYCLGGRIAGPCSAGYLCYSGSDTPTPDGSDPTVGEICPFGFYCEEGAANVSACEPGKVIAYEGAMSVLECQLCPAGYICSVDNVLPQPCTPGYYCEFDADRTPCPNTTYSSESGATNSSTCQPCPAGFWCNEPALTNYTKVPCPLGHYCPTATDEPMPCPPGTYRSLLGAEDEFDCFICPPGYYCPNDTANIYEIECDEGQFCPEGSWAQRDCQPGYYCNRSITQEKCPAGYYCPVRSPYPIQCPAGHYCGEECGYLNDTAPCPGSITPVICPLGYREKEGSRRSTFENTCEVCPAGYYGNMPDRANCTICEAGVVCLEGATTDYPLDNTTMHGVNYTNSFPCPVGYYCPEGSSAASPCPVGTFRSAEYAVAASDCLVCGVDHFNHLTGQQGCFHCGSQATTEGAVGSSECTCNGANQEFQFTDRQCICQHGYSLRADGNTETCTKTVYDQCDEGTYRNQQGQCWTESEWEDYCMNEKYSTH